MPCLDCILRGVRTLPSKDVYVGPDFPEFCDIARDRSASQLAQDLFVLFILEEKRGGFFVEFGATNGRDLSNTVLLEEAYGWTGILAEPARCWHEALKRNRSAVVDTRFVWSQSGQAVPFVETVDAEFSTLDGLLDCDFNAAKRAPAARYDVETISLNDLLALHGAPRRIDYLSIDTEGTEYEVLQAFDFAAYDVGVITVEHNYAPHRDSIFALLRAHGYERVFTELSKWDDWYVKAPYAVRIRGSLPESSEGSCVDIYAPSEPLALVGPGWYRLERSQRGEDFRWVGPDASVNVARLTPDAQLVRLDVEAGPAVGLKHFRLAVFEDGVQVAAIDVDGRRTVEFLLPPGEPRVHRLSLHVQDAGEPVEAPGDRRTLSFRVFKIALAAAPATPDDRDAERAPAERSELERRLTREVEARDVLIGRLESAGIAARTEIEELSRQLEERQRRIDELAALAEERLNVIRTMHETSETR